MTFGEVLTEAINSVDGIIAACLVGLDGIGVEMVLQEGVEGFDREEVEVELSGMVSSINRSLNTLTAGRFKELMLETSNLSYLITLLDSDYFLAFILSAEANLGRARYELRRTSQRLRETN